ncbi:MAG: zinc ribbon domain-containing protein [Dehalococcoidia bacterium]|nr:zinc ribbon domain-containing protein [Dehalococcoidia bacterium]
MALYEYLCESCKGGKPHRFELRMPMKDAVQFAPCPRCGKQAQKTIGSFAVTGLSKSGMGGDMDFGDMDFGDMDMGGMDMGGMGGMDPMMGHSHDHGHDHGHPHTHDDLGLDDMDF